MADTDLVPVGTRPSPLSSGMSGLPGLMNQPAVKRSLPLIGLLGALAIAALAWWTFQTPAQRPLFDGLAENDKAAVASALQSAGVAYNLDGASGAISVAEQDFHRARMLLAGQGLPKAAPNGDSLISALPMGASRAVEGQTLKTAREADLARTIEAIDQVASARVHLATPDPSPFVRDAAPPAASVMLRLQPGRSLSEAQVRAIRHLVASSVPGLNADQVSVIDQSGALLSQQGGAGADQQFQLQTQMEERFRQALVTLLTPIMGAGNFSTEVHVELERSEIQSTRETYPKDDMALRQEQGNKSIGSSQTPGGIPGATSNTQPAPTQATNAAQNQPAAQAGAAPPPTTEQFSRSFDVGREISVTHQPTGRMKRVSVAVALNSGRALRPAEAAQIENLVKGTVGFDAQRGDNVVISARAFAKEPVETPSLIDNPMLMPALRQGGALLAALLAFFFIGRPIMRALKARAAEPAPVDEALVTQLIGATARNDEAGAGLIGSPRNPEERAEMIRTFVRQNPERAAQVVRQLLQDPAK
jgi:flagellar M-ring protein FliF